MSEISPQDQGRPQVVVVGPDGMAMASTYNTRPLPAEVVIDGDEVRLARRRQTIGELLDQSLW